MTGIYKGCPFAGCNAPEGECDGACMKGVPGEPVEREDNPLLCEILGFLGDLCHPERYGHAVTADVRKRARELAAAIETAEGMA